jgi:hypothetical protein
MTGSIGDVVLVHPLTLHSASKNGRRLPRVISNPNTSLTEPFNFCRPNSSEYSLVELKTIHDIGAVALASTALSNAPSPKSTSLPSDNLTMISASADKAEETRKALTAGLSKLRDWHITGPRRDLIPSRLKIQAGMRKDEERRLATLGLKH